MARKENMVTRTIKSPHCVLMCVDTSIGEVKKIEKTEKILHVSSGEKIRKRHNINKLDENELKLTGFTNKEIKKIFSEARKNKIRSNIELIDIIGTERYTEVENRIKYND